MNRILTPRAVPEAAPSPKIPAIYLEMYGNEPVCAEPGRTITGFLDKSEVRRVRAAVSGTVAGSGVR
jgi:hypothetical protein